MKDTRSDYNCTLCGEVLQDNVYYGNTCSRTCARILYVIEFIRSGLK